MRTLISYIVYVMYTDVGTEATARADSADTIRYDVHVGIRGRLANGQRELWKHPRINKLMSCGRNAAHQ